MPQTKTMTIFILTKTIIVSILPIEDHFHFQPLWEELIIEAANEEYDPSTTSN